jgi:hypothetical protein
MRVGTFLYINLGSDSLFVTFLQPMGYLGQLLSRILDILSSYPGLIVHVLIATWFSDCMELAMTNNGF